jgi:uncharacterized alpha-E superfamily protein
MLSRVADSLFWMSTYLERAEHTARLLDVNLGLMLDENEAVAERRWFRVLAALGYVPSLMWKNDAYDLAQRLSFDMENRSSIYACLVAARENARQVREQISTEQWQRLNQLFHQATRMERRPHTAMQQSDFLASVIEGIHLFQGVTDSTMSHGEGWQFIRLGRYLERGAATARLLKVYYEDFWSGSKSERSLFQADSVADSNEYLECIGLLRSCTAFEAWFRVYSTDISYEQILDFLLLDEEFPHAIRYSVDSVEAALIEIAAKAPGRIADPMLRAAGSLRASLQFAEIDELLKTDIGEFLQRVLDQCRAVHDLTYQLYIHYSVQTALAN